MSLWGNYLRMPKAPALSGRLFWASRETAVLQPELELRRSDRRTGRCRRRWPGRIRDPDDCTGDDRSRDCRQHAGVRPTGGSRESARYGWNLSSGRTQRWDRTGRTREVADNRLDELAAQRPATTEISAARARAALSEEELRRDSGHTDSLAWCLSPSRSHSPRSLGIINH